MMNQELPFINPSTIDFCVLKTYAGLISPAIAAELLERNFEANRTVFKSVVNKYARLMSDGLWGLSEAIKFSVDGKLIDGQHRLQAVIASGTTQSFLVTTGYPFSSTINLDQGKNRGALDIASIYGKQLSSLDVSLLRMCCSIGSQRLGYDASVLSPKELVIVADFYRDRLEFAKQFAHSSSAIKSAPVLSCVLLASFQENHERLTDFLYCFHNGVVKNGVIDNAALLLRDYYQSKHKVSFSTNGSTGRAMLYRKSQSAIQYFLSKSCPKILRETEKILWGKENFSIGTLKRIVEDHYRQVKSDGLVA